TALQATRRPGTGSTDTQPARSGKVANENSGEGEITGPRMASENQPPKQGPIHFLLGFNLIIDRISIMRLMGTVGVALDRGAQSITICMSSQGGAQDQAFYAYELLKSSPVPITTYNLGVVQSAALTLFLAGSKRYAVPHATFLMHKTVYAPQAGLSHGQDLLN